MFGNKMKHERDRLVAHLYLFSATTFYVQVSTVIKSSHEVVVAIYNQSHLLLFFFFLRKKSQIVILL